MQEKGGKEERMVENTIGLMLDDFFFLYFVGDSTAAKKKVCYCFSFTPTAPVDDTVHVSRVTTVPLFLYIYRRPISIYFTSPFINDGLCPLQRNYKLINHVRFILAMSKATADTAGLFYDRWRFTLASYCRRLTSVRMVETPDTLLPFDDGGAQCEV